MIRPRSPSISTRLLELSLPGVLESIQVARDAVAEASASHVGDEAVEVVRLLTGELASNCFRHGRGDIGVLVELRGPQLSVTIRDEGSSVVGVRPFGPGPGGHGLRLVEEMSDGWEQVSSDPTTVRFWLSAET